MIETVVAVVVIILVVLAIFLAVSLRHSADGQTTLFGRPVYSVGSGSMTPTFDTGDLIVDKTISAKSAEHLHKGQIVTFQAAASVGNAAGLVITHRIYSVVSGVSVAGVRTVEYRTKGDANNAPDAGLVAPTAILGVYQGERVPFGGYALSTLHQPITFVILILIVVVYLGEELIRRKWIALGVQDAQRKQDADDRLGQV
ncbi:MAG TPA: signal peptidase I [Candidatus Dormibacteraeota bacterium]|nr:signal peptidase I [Candidatus Dormibacteraeota bacterium]